MTGKNTTVGNGVGILITGSGNTIGSTTPEYENMIVYNKGDGVRFDLSPNNNQVVGNVINSNAGDGIDIISGANANTIGGPVTDSSEPGNVITGNSENGIEINGSAHITVEGNSIGVNSTGVTAVGNSLNGVLLENGAWANQIGVWAQGSQPFTNAENTGNIISGNGKDGVLDTSPTAENYDAANWIAGNSIGIGGDGATKLANGQNGIEINQVVGETVIGNVISGNSLNGVQITGNTASGTVIATSTAVINNLIGTNGASSATIGNGGNGIYLYLADQNTIGGATNPPAGQNQASNIISGNKNYGIEVGSSKNLVVNNYIGTDVTGKKAIGNWLGGVNIGWSNQGKFTLPANIVAAGNTIGGTGGLNSTLNIISGNQGGNANDGNGVTLWNSGVQNTFIEGNYIGVDVTGLNPLGNQDGGVVIYVTDGGAGPTNTTIGVAGADGGNVISANQGKWFQEGLQAYGGSGVYQNNTIGFNSQGTDPNSNMKNGAGEVNLTGIWTDKGGNKVQ